MRAILTADQFRFIWRLAGGDAILMPIQAPSRGRMASDRDRIEIELAAWWAANPEPGLYEAVRDLRQSPAWLHLQGFPAVGKPIRALLGVGGGGRSVLAVQDATAAVRDEDGENRDWYPDTAGTSSGWSLERGGDVRLSVGHAETLVARMAAVVGEFTAGSTVQMSAETGAPPTGYTSQATTTSKSERIAALLRSPRAQHGFLSASVTDGAEPRRIGQVAWVEVLGDGGYLVEGPADLTSVKPAAHGDLATAARRLLVSAHAASGVV